MGIPAASSERKVTARIRYDTSRPSSSGTRLGSEVSPYASPPTQVSRPLERSGVPASVTCSSNPSDGVSEVNRTWMIVEERSSETSG